MKIAIIFVLILVLNTTAACQTPEPSLSDSEKAKQYYEDGVKCFEKLDFLCSLTLLEQVWYLDEFSEIDVKKWTYYTAESNYLVAIDKNTMFPFDKKIGSAERAEAMFKILGPDFDDRRLVLQYFIVRSLEDPCDERRIAAISRFEKTKASTTNRPEIEEIKSLTSKLIQDNSTC